jgi:hypothetical protein
MNTSIVDYWLESLRPILKVLKKLAAKLRSSREKSLLLAMDNVSLQHKVQDASKFSAKI